MPGWNLEEIEHAARMLAHHPRVNQRNEVASSVVNLGLSFQSVVRLLPMSLNEIPLLNNYRQGP